MNLEDIKKVKWKYLVNRRESLLFRSIISNSHKYFKRITNIPWELKSAIRFTEGDVFYDEKDLEKLRSIFIKKGDKVFNNFKKRLLEYVNNLDVVASEVEKTNCSKLTKDELNKLLDKYMKAALYAGNFLLPIPIIDKIISKKILDSLSKTPERQKQELLGILIYPSKENYHIKEEKAFYDLIKNYNKKDFNKLLRIHLNKFDWIGARGYYFNDYWKKDNILKRIKNFISQKKDIDKEIENLEKIKKEKLSSFEKIIKELKIKKTSSLYKLILIAKEYAYLRTWRTDVIYRAGYKARNLFYEIAERAGLNKDDIIHFTLLEAIEMAKKEKSLLSSKQLRKRKKIFTSVAIKNKYIIISDKDLEEKIKDIVLEKRESKTKEVSGNVAFQGKVRGRVKIVFTTKDLNKVKQGNILVAVMTFPHYISAMEKAAAFVTDEGGILCHAAIISREMKKPCIIGTKIATKVLKDGDLVEVDANKGVVRILKK
jgi:phosphohistidine swiveling domain-containing protein